MAKLIIDLVLILFSSWTISYHIVLAARWPYYNAIIIALAFAAFFLHVYFRVFNTRIKPVLPADRSKRIPVIAIAVLGLAFGLFCASITGSDPDTIGYFTNPIIQAYNLRSPIPLNMVGLASTVNLPPYSTPLLLIAVEPLVALTGRLTGITPGIVYQSILPFFIGILTILCFYYVFRKLGLTRWEAFFAITGVLVFFYITGNPQQYGNWLVLRNYRGKAFLAATFIPVYLVSTFRYLLKPTGKKLFLLALYPFAFSGAATSGPVWILLTIFSAGVAFILSIGFNKETFLKLAATGIYPFVLLVLIYFQLVPMNYSTSTWSQYTYDWFSNVTRLLGGNLSIIGAGLLLFAVPLLMLKKQKALFFTMYSLVLVLLFANQIISPILASIITGANQGRIYYLLPLPTMAGFLPILTVRSFRQFSEQDRKLGLIISLMAILAISAGAATPLKIEFKAQPFDLKIDPRFQTFMKEYPVERFSDSVMLTSAPFIEAFTLTNPSITQYSIRTNYLGGIGKSYGLFYESLGMENRGLLQESIQTCNINLVQNESGVLETFHEIGVNYVLFPNCDQEYTDSLIDYLGQAGGQWKAELFLSTYKDRTMRVWILSQE